MKNIKQLPLVSIVTPSYNQGRFIRQCIESVLTQGYPRIEYIIIDGGSTDETIDIIKEYEDKLIWISEKDEGQSDAINKGFKMAKGEIIAWLNSDDTYEPGAVENSVKYFIEDNDIVLTYGEGYITNDKDEKVKKFDATQEFDLWTLINVWDYIMQPTTFFRRKTVEEIGYLDKKLNWCMDWDLWIRLANVGKVKYIPEFIADSREYGDTKTSTGGSKRFKEIVQLMRKYSGKKYMPGYFLYGSSTLYSRVEEIKFLNALGRGGMYLVHTMVFSNLPIRYADGWIGKRYCFIVPVLYNAFQLEGRIICNKVLPCKVDVYQGKSLIKHVKIENSGVFKIDIDKLDTANEERNINMKINRQFKPENDKRKLSLIIDEVQYFKR
jgi:glycosyltransferase involved in cell wall biosynthesis